LHQVDTEIVPLALAHSYAIAPCLIVGKHIRGRAWRIVVTDYAQCEQTIAIIALLMGKIVSVELTVAIVRVVT
jgi:hypothetical protein